jgi:uncharacterized protein
MTPNKRMVQGEAGNLEICVDPPLTSPRKLMGIICHPHPLYAGTMSNKVVTTVMRVFQRLDIVPVRFNFRGVGQSEGKYDDAKGELNDLRTIIQWTKQEYPDYQLMLAGFSFGSYIAMKIATEVHPRVLITIAPPVHHFHFNALPPVHFPWIVVQGEADEVVPPEEVFVWLDSLTIKPIIIRMSDASHFFHGQLIILQDKLMHELSPFLPEV